MSAVVETHAHKSEETHSISFFSMILLSRCAMPLPDHRYIGCSFRPLGTDVLYGSGTGSGDAEITSVYGFHKGA